MRTAIITLCEHIDIESKPLLNAGEPTSIPVPGCFGFNAGPAIPALKTALDKKMASTPPSPTLPPSSPNSLEPVLSSTAVLFEQLGDMIRDLEYQS